MNMLETHKELLDNATKAVFDRTFYAAYPEHPKAYGEEGNAKAQEWFNNQLNNRFEGLLQMDPTDFVGDEVSPYTQQELNIKYPFFSPETLVERAKEAWPLWRNALPDTRAAILMESLERIKERFFDIAYATMHTSGQSFMMSFQASGPHASDRALETIVLGLQELKRFPFEAQWDKPMGKFNVRLKKTWRAIGKGVSLVVGCSTFPVWNTVPGVYASLITGNPVIVKPHAGGILPIAIVVSEIQKALLGAGFNPDLVQLAADTRSVPITKELANNKDVKIIDYTGGTSFGDYLEALPGKVVFTEKAGVNSVIIDSTDDLDPVLQNLAFAACLYSGQMCTAPQNFFIPTYGVGTKDDVVPYEEVVRRFVDAVKGLTGNPKMGPGTLGALQSVDTHQRLINAAALKGTVLLESREIKNDEFPNARTFSPIIIEVDAKDKDVYSHELFGPIILIIKTDNSAQSTDLARALAEEKGALSCGAYTTNDKMKEYITSEMEAAYTPVAFNFTGPIWMNQNAAFSDFHVTGGNPAGNATFTDSAYVVRRFVWVGHKEAIQG